MKTKELKSSCGFTIIEMVIIFGILMIISATLITSLHTGEQQIALFKEQARIISVISRAKSLSVATFGEKSVPVPCGYGVHFEAPNFLIFEDLADNCQNADNKYSSMPNEIYESFQLDPRVVFDTVGLTDIDFIPPNPTIVITPIPENGEAIIILKTANGINQATIRVNGAGQISTE